MLDSPKRNITGGIRAHCDSNVYWRQQITSIDSRVGAEVFKSHYFAVVLCWYGIRREGGEHKGESAFSMAVLLHPNG